jgi:hypothetical protein
MFVAARGVCGAGMALGLMNRRKMGHPEAERLHPLLRHFADGYESFASVPWGK